MYTPSPQIILFLGNFKSDWASCWCPVLLFVKSGNPRSNSTGFGLSAPGPASKAPDYLSSLPPYILDSAPARGL